MSRVVHDESGVDAEPTPTSAEYVVGVRMAAEPVAGLEQGDLVAALQQIGGGEPGDAAAHDDDLRTIRSLSGGCLRWSAHGGGSRPGRLEAGMGLSGSHQV